MSHKQNDFFLQFEHEIISEGFPPRLAMARTSRHACSRNLAEKRILVIRQSGHPQTELHTSQSIKSIVVT
jgi:hypothetical protein